MHMPGFAAREIGRIETTYDSSLGRLSWAWILRADGTIAYRLIQVDGRPERNDWQLVRRLTPTEKRAIGRDRARAQEFLTQTAREHGHHPTGSPR
jgi:hypothetical protein